MPNLQRKIRLLFALIFAFYGGIISRPAEAAGAHFVFECGRVELSKGYVTVYGDLWNDGNESGTLTDCAFAMQLEDANGNVIYQGTKRFDGIHVTLDAGEKRSKMFSYLDPAACSFDGSPKPKYFYTDLIYN